MSRCSRVRIKVFRPNRSATVVAGLLLGIFFLLLGRPAHADTPITLVQSFAGRLNFAGTEATLRAAGNNTDACTVSNSAPATLSGIPTGATIKAAYLYWAGSSTPGYYWIIPAVPPDYTVTFENQSITAPANEQYLVQRTSAYGIGSNVFSGVADVTSIVQGRADPNGTYTLSDLTVDTNDYTHCAEQTVLAGWALLVIYSDPGEDFRVVNIYQGFQSFQGSEIVLVPSNFLVPSSPINGKFAHITWEGDRTNSAPANGFVEALEFDGSSLIDATNPAAEQFNSKSSAVNPDDQASWGVDFDVYDVTGYLSSGITSATSTYSSGGDLVLLSAEVLSITNTPVSDLAVTLA
ncbi:MAG TPA: hypothetical protein VFK45_07780, partial [Gammaproteobacteria bacterium]|nr:hypothetical protein [Gammaproteobacteria bacterium]